MTFAELTENVENMIVSGNPQVAISKVEVDSRLINAGDLFIAVPGFAFDGLSFVPEVVQRGAHAIIGATPFEANVACRGVVRDIRGALAKIAARYHDYPTRKFTLIGITGTNGKTTVTYLLKTILESGQASVGLVGTLGYQTAQQFFQAINTTPGSLELERLFAVMASENVQYVVMEVSSHALAMKRVEELEFQVAAITNITQDHLDYHKDFVSYREAKAHLLDLVSGQAKWTVLNRDDPSCDYLSRRVKTPFLTFSLDNPKADLKLEEVKMTHDGSDFILVTPRGKEQVHYQLLGRFNLENALCAAACAVAIGLDLQTIAQGLGRQHHVRGRAQKISCGQPFTVLIDYAHTPDGLTKILEAGRELAKKRLLVLFGCGGDRDRTKRPLMGKAASAAADVVIVTSDNPRSEDPLQIIEEIKPGLSRSCLTLIEPDRRQAIVTALSLCSEGDLLVVAGKGHEDYQIIGTEKIHLDDREVVEEWLKEQYR